MARLEENVRAAGIQLSEAEVHEIEDELPRGAVVGERYAPALMENVNR
jgi:aryl-alcohol dehydrogenase-like predicted oxidoreductase